jgi:RHS repeat-associated protein
MPIEFTQHTQPTGSSSDTLFKLLMKYDGAGRRISKTSMRKSVNSDEWDTALVTHYSGIGTEVRENFSGSAKETKVVVNMPQGLGRYGIEDAESPNYDGVSGDSLAGYIPNAKFEWYLKNHLGSTMLVYGTQSDANPQHVFVGAPLAAYDYRAFGEMVEMLPPAQKVTENFTGKEHDDEIALDYFGARYLDPMLGMWISVDPKRQFASPYLYAGNGMNPVNGVDGDGNYYIDENGQTNLDYDYVIPDFQAEVTVGEMNVILAAHEALQSKFRLLDDLLPSYALKSYMYGREIAFDLQDVTKFTVGTEKSVPTTGPGFDKFVFHLHSFRYDGSKEGFSPADNGICNQYDRWDYMMEITSGNVYFQNSLVNQSNAPPGVVSRGRDDRKTSTPFLLMKIPLRDYTPNR